ncbi:hypothetical protein [Ornithinimicrobium faecis]|uniref:hypothetical protein n=1 Tax=Ornithinimicrobium faecis TaxID=2934158 RepID=UPI00211830E7|nr:hypothetical protein [Ornithinimicrobium sp. HY1745]
MTAEPDVLDLRSDDHPWTQTTIPGSDRSVGLRRLHLDPQTRATLSLVRFPQGWSRPGTGHYECAEEFTVLAGALEVSGVRHAAGDHVYLPPRFVRAGSVSPTGCLALAFFSTAPVWRDGLPTVGADHPPRTGPPAGVMRHPRPGIQGGCALVTDALAPLEEDSDVLTVPSGRWALVPAGAEPPLTGPAIVRVWGPRGATTGG